MRDVRSLRPRSRRLPNRDLRPALERGQHDDYPAPPKPPAHPIAPRPGRGAMSAEDTDLERRVLAHEQILQALIAHIVESEPRFLDRLSATFANPLHIVPARHDRVSTASHAARFVREIVRLAGTPASPSLVSRWDDLWPTSGEADVVNDNAPVRFEIRRHDDLWEVRRDGHLRGGYVSRSGALSAVQAEMQELFEGGGCAELLADRPQPQPQSQPDKESR